MHIYNLQAKLISGNWHLMLVKGHCGICKSNETAVEIRTLCPSNGPSSYLELDMKKLNSKNTPRLIISPETGYYVKKEAETLKPVVVGVESGNMSLRLLLYYVKLTGFCEDGGADADSKRLSVTEKKRSKVKNKIVHAVKLYDKLLRIIKETNWSYHKVHRRTFRLDVATWHYGYERYLNV
ncbi:hypothetical protein Glove_681g10 [Diversispora epigaea]|uniref:Uncharacterized protein n=1 Tax=Diversispora epigaea TaxID=1348612 RepID=A0A397G2X6_9GLOM|nr:hypothetical protein Glove_681g10 [Diversispora epigaea]